MAEGSAGMEIITGVERRRQWRDEEKLRILSELDEPGARFADVARRHEVSRGLLWQWRDARRRGKLTSERPSFVPVRVVRELPAPELQGAAGPTPAKQAFMAWPTHRVVQSIVAKACLGFLSCANLQRFA